MAMLVPVTVDTCEAAGKNLAAPQVANVENVKQVE